MGEQIAVVEEALGNTAAVNVGKLTVLEALSQPTNAVSLDQSRQSTQSGQGVDFEDD